MSDVPLHRLFHHYSEMPYSLRTMYTATLLLLGMAYLFALIYLFHTYAGRSTGNPMMLTYEDLVVAYSGSAQNSRLEGALRGPMRDMLPPDELSVLVRWVHDGSPQARYATEIQPVIQKRCSICHDGSNPHLPTLTDFDNLKKVTQVDTGTDIFTLVRVSHIHLFGLTFVFFIMGTMFHHAYVRPVWFKCTVIALPFLAIVADVSSWYFTKLFHPFAWIVILGGALMGLCFAFMWLVTMYQMWFSRPPRMVIERRGDDPTSVD
ncbi:MAG: hypothetical protein ACHQIO_06390 [Nevskiales bacterium]